MDQVFLCIDELGWPSVQTHRSYISIWILFSILHKRMAINFSDYFEFNMLATRSHSLTLHLVSSSISAYRHSLWLHHFYGTQFHLKFYPSQLQEALINWNATCFVNSLILCLFVCVCYNFFCCNCMGPPCTGNLAFCATLLLCKIDPKTKIAWGL